jgi:hypothetical protein
MRRTGRIWAVIAITVTLGSANLGTAGAAVAASASCDEDPTRLGCLSDAWAACSDTYSVETQTSEWTRCHTQSVGDWLCPEGSECRAFLKEHMGTCSSVEVCAGLLELVRELLPIDP